MSYVLGGVPSTPFLYRGEGAAGAWETRDPRGGGRLEQTELVETHQPIHIRCQLFLATRNPWHLKRSEIRTFALVGMHALVRESGVSVTRRGPHHLGFAKALEMPTPQQQNTCMVGGATDTTFSPLLNNLFNGVEISSLTLICQLCRA